MRYRSSFLLECILLTAPLFLILLFFHLSLHVSKRRDMKDKHISVMDPLSKGLLYTSPIKPIRIGLNLLKIFIPCLMIDSPRQRPLYSVIIKINLFQEKRWKKQVRHR